MHAGACCGSLYYINCQCLPALLSYINQVTQITRHGHVPTKPQVLSLNFTQTILTIGKCANRYWQATRLATLRYHEERLLARLRRNWGDSWQARLHLTLTRHVILGLAKNKPIYNRTPTHPHTRTPIHTGFLASTFTFDSHAARNSRFS